MKVSFTLLFVFAALHNFSQESINVDNIDIVRDKWGVPHIFGKTDAEVAYGLAYAHAEDDFKTTQIAFLAGKSMLGTLKGKDGAVIDYIVHLFRIRKLVEEKYANDISAKFKTILQGYCDGFNAYGKANPRQVLVRKLFPLTPKDMLAYSVLQLCVSSGIDHALKRITGGDISPPPGFSGGGGSNGFAFNSKLTADSNVYLNINSHQPLEGPVSWYEAHLCSEEGWNITGALFPGAPSILIGTNQFLGWTHTVNSPDKLDVYQLDMDPQNKRYRINGEWTNLEESTVRLQVKISGVKVGVKKKIYYSKYGPTLVTKTGTYSIRTGAMFDIRALEQWYWMNKSTNFSEFKQALKMEAISGYNIIYADRYDTIYYLSNGKIPIRNKEYEWRGTLPGNTSQTLWTNYHPLEDLPQVLNPSSGYLFNSNHSPFNASDAKDNIRRENYDETMGYETHDNNRSRRFMELISQFRRLDYEDFKRIKYDIQLPGKLAYPSNGDTLFLLIADEYPAVSDLVHLLNNWDRRGTLDSKAATVFAVVYNYVAGQLAKGNTGYSRLNKKTSVEVLLYTKDYLLKNFKTIEVPLGEYQKLVRGKKELPLMGLPDVIASMETVPYKNGMVKGSQGESFIQLVRFAKDGPQIESVNCYGASNIAGNKHYDDQMDLFVQQKSKKMTLDKTKVYEEAERIYHPK